MVSPASNPGSIASAAKATAAAQAARAPAPSDLALSRAAESLSMALGVQVEVVTGAAPAPDPSVVLVGVPGAGGEQCWLVARCGEAGEAAETGKAGEAGQRPQQLRPLLQAFAALAGSLSDHAGQLHHRIAELRAVYQVTSALSGIGDLESILQCALRLAMEVMNVKAGSIRLFNPATDELTLRASVNLSAKYFAKGAIFAHESELDTRALAGEVVYVEDLALDERIRFPDLVADEGLRSFLSTGLIFRGKPVGVMRLYTGEVRRFSDFDRNLFRAVAQQAATAIANARLLEDQRSARDVKRQVDLASNVQRRMLPQRLPSVAGLDIAARCIPSLELGGDFYDFIDLGRNLGVSLGDVVGKGVPAALLMASVRASLRAHATDIYDINEIMARTNRALVDDTHEHEFATVWYGVIDLASMRLTYTNAGHDPPFVFRPALREQGSEAFRDLRAGGPVLGIQRSATYEKGLFDLQVGDVLVVYSDGLTDAQTYDRERYTRQRLGQAVVDSASLSQEVTASLVLNHILWDVRRFVGLNPQYDDITLVVARITGAASGRP